MKLASLKNGKRDGRLVVVSRDLGKAVDAGAIAPTLQYAIENWQEVEAPLNALYESLNANQAEGAFLFDPNQAAAPFPRAYQWLDGSCFLSHGRLMEKAFNIDPIPGSDEIPLMYQGAGDDFLGPHDELMLPSEEDGIDFEGEFAIVVDDVDMGCSAEAAAQHIKLVMQVNDMSLRKLGPREMRTGFGFVQAKSSSSFAPVAVTPDELGPAWQDGRVNLPLRVYWNEQLFGEPQGGEMHFSFPQLIEHAARTRRLRAGTIIGSGTVSNDDNERVGSACIAERRALEIIATGAPVTEFMRFGDSVRMDVTAADGRSVFGAIDQRVVASGREGAQ